MLAMTRDSEFERQFKDMRSLEQTSINNNNFDGKLYPNTIQFIAMSISQQKIVNRVRTALPHRYPPNTRNAPEHVRFEHMCIDMIKMEALNHVAKRWPTPIQRSWLTTSQLNAVRWVKQNLILDPEWKGTWS